MKTTTAVSSSPLASSWRQRILTRRFLFISIAAHLFFAGLAAFWIVQIRQAQKPRTFHSGPASANPAASAAAHQAQMARQRNLLAAPPAPTRITTTGAAKIALPPMPAMPSFSALTPMPLSGMSGAPSSLGFNGGGLGSGFGTGGSFTGSIGGLNIQARRLAVALDVSGSMKQYQEPMRAYVAKTFKGSEVGEFGTAGFYETSRTSMGTVLLNFLRSAKMFDAIYVFSDFNETIRGEQTQLPEVEQLIRQKKVRLYLHVLCEPRRVDRITTELSALIGFARGTGGNVKIGPMLQE